MYNFTSAFSLHITCNEKYTHNGSRTYFKKASQTLTRTSLLLAWISNVMYVFINKQLTVFKIALAFYSGFGREKIKRHFLPSNVSEGNIRLCRQRCVARDPRVERCRSNVSRNRVVMSEWPLRSAKFPWKTQSCVSHLHKACHQRYYNWDVGGMILRMC
jgi:hypothetical protein